MRKALTKGKSYVCSDCEHLGRDGESNWCWMWDKEILNPEDNHCVAFTAEEWKRSKYSFVDMVGKG